MKTNLALYAALVFLLGTRESSGQSTSAVAPLQPPAFSTLGLGTPAPPGWTFVGLVHQTKPKTIFQIVDEPGNGKVLRIDANQSYGNLASFGSAIAQPSTVLSWSWKLVKGNPRADLTQRSGDDTPIKVCVLFDYALDALSLGERTEMRIIRAQSDTPVPAASVCYVWDHSLGAGQMLPSPFTKRITYIVVESGDEHLGQWQSVRRDVLADFQKAYGPEYAKLGSQDPPHIIGILVGADSDNTGVTSESEIGDIAYTP